MKWSRIKNIMLWFLIIINLFMLIFIAVDSYRKTIIPKEVISASMEYLEDSNFSCERDEFPKSYRYAPTLDVSFYSASDLAEVFFGKQVAFRTSENSLIADYEGCKLTVYSNYFTYTTPNQPVKASSAQLSEALEKLGIDTAGMVYDKKNSCFYKMYKKANLFDMYITAQLDAKGNICTIKAQWPKKIKPLEEKKISFSENLIKLKKAFPEGGNIKNIELGYCLKHIGGEKFNFVPAWRVNVDGELKILN